MAIDPYGRLAFGHLLQLHTELVSEHRKHHKLRDSFDNQNCDKFHLVPTRSKLELFLIGFYSPRLFVWHIQSLLDAASR